MSEAARPGASEVLREHARKVRLRSDRLETRPSSGFHGQTVMVATIRIGPATSLSAMSCGTHTQSAATGEQLGSAFNMRPMCEIGHRICL